MSEAKTPFDKYRRLEDLFITTTKLVVMTAGFFIIGNAFLYFAFATAHGGWLKILIGLFGIFLTIAWFVVGGHINANYNFSYRGLLELENNLPGPERVYLVMSRQRDSLAPFLRIFLPNELLLKFLPGISVFFWLIFIIFRPA